MIKKISGLEGDNMALLHTYCGYCGAEIAWKRTWKKKWSRKMVKHVNICQEPPVKYFCNRDCKINWIFKRPGLKLEKDINGNCVKEDIESIFDMAVIEEKTDELEKYLKNNNLKILREA